MFAIQIMLLLGTIKGFARGSFVAGRLAKPTARFPAKAIFSPPSRFGVLRTRTEIGRYLAMPDGGSNFNTTDDAKWIIEDRNDDGSLEDMTTVLENDVEEGAPAEISPLVAIHAAWSKAVEKTFRGLEKKTKSLEAELEKAQNLEQTVQRAQLLVSNMYMFNNPSIKSAIVQDWENGGEEVELVLNPKYDSASAEADALFQLARKMKRGSQVVEELLSEANDAIETLNECKTDLQSARIGDNEVDEGRLQIVQGRLQRTSKQTKFQPPMNEPAAKDSGRMERKRPRSSRETIEKHIRKLTSPGGCKILVGRNRRGNEYLTFNVARGDDVWMHARGYPGAHVLIQVRRGGPQPTDKCIELAANLAAFYSDARTEQRASITAAEPKHLLKPRGAPLGAVKLREELYVLVGKPEDVPEELKVARDASGLSDEYRSSDKAKHRRWTKAVAKQKLAKRRAEQRAKRKRRHTSQDDTQ